MGLAPADSAAVPETRPSDPIPSLRLPTEQQQARAERPQSARGTVAGGLLPHKADTWSTPDVGKWLQSLGLGRYVETFDQNEISGAILVDMTAEDLDYLDVKVLAHRKLLLKGITKLKQAIEAGDAAGMTLPTPRSPPAHAYRMAPEDQQTNNVGAESAPSPPKGGNMVHWSALQPLAPQGQPEGGSMSVQGAPAAPKSLADMAFGEYDEAAEQAAFREAVMAWRGGSGASPGSSLAKAATAAVGGGGDGSADAWSNPADAPAPSAGGRFAASLGSSAGGGAFSSTLGGKSGGDGSSDAASAKPRSSVQISRTADAGSSAGGGASSGGPSGGFNPLLQDGPDEEAEHAAFREAVLAWRGEPAPSAGGKSAVHTSHATGSGQSLAAPNAALTAEAAKALGVDPATVESSTWYTGYKTLFGGGDEGGVDAFNEHVRALHEAKRKARGGAMPAPQGATSSSDSKEQSSPSTAAAGQSAAGAAEQERRPEQQVTSPHVSVQEEGGDSTFIQARVTTSRGGHRSSPVTSSGGAAARGGALDGWGGKQGEGDDDIEDMDDLPDVPQPSGSGGVISLVDFSALDGLASAAAAAAAAASPTKTAADSSPSTGAAGNNPQTEQPQRGAAPRDIWSVDFEY